MSKTPYEIRLNILQLAKDYLDSVSAANTDLVKQVFEQTVDMNQEIVSAAKELSSSIPKQYSQEELMRTAENFYRFVSFGDAAGDQKAKSEKAKN